MTSRKTLTLAEKLGVIDLFEKCPTLSQKVTAEKYGVSIATISRILKNKQSLKAMVAKVPNLNRKRQRSSIAPDVDEALFKWFCQASAVQGIPLSGDVLKEKALFFAKSLNIEQFKASDGWLWRWKTRFNVMFKKVQDENRYSNSSSATSYGMDHDFNQIISTNHLLETAPPVEVVLGNVQDGTRDSDELFTPANDIDQKLKKDFLADDFNQTPPLDKNLIIYKQKNYRENDKESESKEIISHTQFLSNLADVKDYLCFHGFGDWKSFNSILTFSIDISSNVNRNQKTINKYFGKVSV